jgi:5-methylcytosine-specific restriction protein A
VPQAPRTIRHEARKKELEELRGTFNQRGYDWHWSKISKMYRAQHPMCEICNDAPAVDVDHKVPFDGLKDPRRTEWSNLQAVCRPCHRAKTERQKH